MVAAQEAVSHVAGAWMTHPDVYAPRACIAARNPNPDGPKYLMFRLAWEDHVLGEYRLDGDASLIVREVVEMTGDEDLGDVVAPWLEPHEPGQVQFRQLPGIFQEAFAVYWTGRDLPVNEVSFVWAPSYTEDDQPESQWVVRRFPAGLEGGPALGELGYVVVPRELVMIWFEQRGW